MSQSSLIDSWRDKTAAQFRPLQASLELTYRCNERCTHCYLDSYEDDQTKILSQDQWFQVLEELRGAGALYLILMGGEAMLSPHFWPILNRASQLGFHVSMITNGLKINRREVAQRLFDSGLSVATMSLYSLDSEIHDQMTSIKWSHKKTIEAINWLQETGVTVGVNCLLTRQNVAGYFDLADWCLERGIEIKADPMITPKFSGDLTPTKLRITPEQTRWYYETLSKKWPAGTPKPNGEKPGDYICNAGKGKCAVNAYGDLLTCIEVREPLGNLMKNAFEEIWYGPEAQKWRQMRVQDISNRPDAVGSFCDHCPGMALHEHRDPLRISEYALEQAEIKAKVYREKR